MNTGFGGFRRRTSPYQFLLLPTVILLVMFAAPQAKADVFTGTLGGADNNWQQWLPITIPSDGSFSTQMTVSGDLTGGNSGHCLYESTKTYNYPYVCGYTSPLGPWGLKAGNYYLGVWTNSSGRGSYTVTTAFTPQPLTNDTEPNDTYTQAGTLPASGSVTGHLGYWNILGSQHYGIDSEDWWRVTLSSAGKLNLSYTYDQALAGATGIELYAQDGSTLIRDTSSTLAAGTYYLRPWLNNGNLFGAYTISLATAAAATVPPSATISATGPLTAQTLTLQNIQIASADLSGGVSVYIVAMLGNTVLTFGPNGWTTQIVAYQSGVTAAPGPVTLISSMDLSGLVGVTFLMGYGNGSGDSALNDMLTKLKFVQLYTITAAASGSNNLLDLALWDKYGSAKMQGAAIEFGDEIGGDFNDEDGDGNPYNVWKNGAVSDSSGFGYDIDWAVSKSTFSAPFTLLWNACLSYGGPDNRFLLGRKNSGFTNQMNSPDPMAQEIYVQYQSGSGSTASLVVGTSAGATVSMANLATTKVTPGTGVPGRTPYDYDAICGDFKLEWNNQTVTSYFNGSKIGDLSYASGYGEPFAVGFRTFANPIKVNTLSVSQP